MHSLLLDHVGRANTCPSPPVIDPVTLRKDDGGNLNDLRKTELLHPLEPVKPCRVPFSARNRGPKSRPAGAECRSVALEGPGPRIVTAYESAPYRFDLGRQAEVIIQPLKLEKVIKITKNLR